MSEKELICIVCPRGCQLQVKKEGEGFNVTGNFCKRGITYGINELENPKRKVTSTVKIMDAIHPRLPVITDQEIPKDKVFLVMDEINKTCVKAPIQYGEIIIQNVLNLGTNIIASRSMEKIKD